ncbi:MAG TPA: hypothetical protein DIU15_14820 [Deltaproteobacteria bacterium]|nr:hypothetical protein [Deltaproteobacteria bacterium]
MLLPSTAQPSASLVLLKAAGLGLLLGAAALLSVGGRTLAVTGDSGPWLIAWSVAGALVLFVGLCPFCLPVSAKIRAPLWLASGVVTAAVLSRHAIEGLTGAAEWTPWSTIVVGPMDMADLTLTGLLLPVLALASLGGDWARGNTRLAAAGALSAAGVVGVVALSVDQCLASVDIPVVAGVDWSPFLVVLSMAWIAVLVRLGTSHKGRGLGTLQRLVGLVAMSGVLVLGSRWFLSVHGESRLLRAGELLLVWPGAQAFGASGGPIGAGAEGVICLLAVVVVVVYTARVAARALPGLGGVVLPLVGLVVSGIVVAVPLAVLVPTAAVLGWLAVVVGAEAGMESRPDE